MMTSHCPNSSTFIVNSFRQYSSDHYSYNNETIVQYVTRYNIFYATNISSFHKLTQLSIISFNHRLPARLTFYLLVRLHSVLATNRIFVGVAYLLAPYTITLSPPYPNFLRESQIHEKNLKVHDRIKIDEKEISYHHYHH